MELETALNQGYRWWRRRKTRVFRTARKGVYFKKADITRMTVVVKLSEEAGSLRDKENPTDDDLDKAMLNLANLLFEFLCDRNGMPFDGITGGKDLLDRYGHGFVSEMGQEMYKIVGKLTPSMQAT